MRHRTWACGENRSRSEQQNVPIQRSKRQLHVPLFLWHSQWQTYSLSNKQRLSKHVSHMGHHFDHCFRRAFLGLFYAHRVENTRHNATKARMCSVQRREETRCMGDCKFTFLFQFMSFFPNSFWQPLIFFKSENPLYKSATSKFVNPSYKDTKINWEQKGKQIIKKNWVFEIWDKNKCIFFSVFFFDSWIFFFKSIELIF